MKTLLALAAAATLAAIVLPGSAQAVTRCTIQEIHALDLRLDARRVRVLDGWLLEADYRRELVRLCNAVPQRYAWADGSFDRATDLVDRLYPGVGTWADTCASSEGGHGGFVYNRQGSGAAGWLQFMPSTFDSVIDAAIARARARGLRNLPPWVRSIKSPLGHALAGAEMIFRGRRGEWSGVTC